MKGFGCEVLAFDISKSEELLTMGVKYLPIDKVFSQSNIISLHCPLTPDTKHIVNENSLAKMKDGVMIINTSRGALIDTADVIKGLTQKKSGIPGNRCIRTGRKPFL